MSNKGKDNNTNNEELQPLTYTRALDHIGTGPFHWKLLAIAGWVNASDAVELLAVSFVLPSATTDLNLSSSDKGWLAAVIFIGMTIGGWTWGTIADKIGRRACLIASLAVNTLSGFFSAFSPTFWWLMILRFLAGVGVGGSIPVVWSYFAEFLPVGVRGTMMVLMAMFWMVGSLIIAGMAWIIIPSSFSYDLFGMNFNSWRFFSAICAVPALLAIFTLVPAFESPRFLLSRGDSQGCISILKHVYRVNRSGRWCGAPSYVEGEERLDALVPDLLASAEAEEEEEHTRLNPQGKSDDHEVSVPMVTTDSSLVHDGIIVDRTCSGRVKIVQNGCTTGLARNRTLFKVQHLRSTVLCAIIFFGLSFGYYGLTMFIPQYFSDLDDVDVYASSFISALATLPGNLLSIWSMKAIGRGKTLGISLFLSSVAMWGVLGAKTSYQVVALMCVFSGICTGAWNATNIIVVELFPTVIRSTAFGFFSGLGRIGAIGGNLVFGEFSVDYPAIPIIIVAACLSASAVASFLLPDTRLAKV